MRFSVAILFVVSTLPLPLRGLVHTAGEIFSLKITPLQDTVSTGHDIELTIKLTNETNHDITLIDRNQYCDYTVEVRDSNGQSAPEKKREFRCGDESAGKIIYVKLKPGEHHEVLIFVDYLFDMTRRDKYAVQVARQIPKELGRGQVKSDTVVITVTE
jgi:hypothetical protein